MSSALRGLMVAVDAAERQRDEARRLLQNTRSAQMAAQGQLDQLQAYANETEGRWGMRANAMMAPEVMFHHYQFMDRLGHAMGLQTTVVQQHSYRVEQAQQVLLQAELRLSSLQKLVAKRRQEIELVQMRREQKQTDERAAQQYFQQRKPL
ncbi:MAG: flagellar export protein FliJ [Giesbergeria sp.]|uniref:flagellar export protein FliJ n=1 Tax=Giesbergeria sp. TaxID=2818473 RepID=UPI002608DF62|nr:flagellar export protein FliJ [Giesbergeria sp.]MDD2610568.1 flagellar export protein FliJ [Giesbergeria sp.]